MEKGCRFQLPFDCLDIKPSITYTVLRLLNKHGEPKLRLRGKQPFSTREPDPDHAGGGMQKPNPPTGGFFDYIGNGFPFPEGKGQGDRSNLEQHLPPNPLPAGRGSQELPSVRGINPPAKNCARWAYNHPLRKSQAQFIGRCY